MDKNIFHLVGMPRAGNTLLGGIINQNPNLQVSPLSPLSRVVSALHLSFEGESWENFDWTSEQDTLARKTAQAWYSELKNTSRYLPKSTTIKKYFNLTKKKPITPSYNEIKINPPSRSAKLRFAYKMENGCDFKNFLKNFKYLKDIENLDFDA